MKKAFAFMLAIVMMLSLGITAFATEVAPGTITITNAAVGETYKLYKLFKATYNADGTSVSYTLEDTALAATMFGSDPFEVEGVGTASTFFNYDANTKVVTAVEELDQVKLFQYLTKLVSDDKVTLVTEGIPGEDGKLAFTGLDFGYYVIKRNNDKAKAVTVDTNYPHVNVEDKSGWPGDLEKEADTTSANIGDTINWTVTYMATNYDGSFEIQYYNIIDTQSQIIGSTETKIQWAEVDLENIQVQVGTQPLTKGQDWFLFADENDDTKFEIVIPWMDNFHVDEDGNLELDKDGRPVFDADSEFIYNKDTNEAVQVTITYSAVVLEQAAGENSNTQTNQNKVELGWGNTDPDDTDDPEDDDEKDVDVYNMGFTKVDATNPENKIPLAGAEFKLYTDEECTEANRVYVTKTADGLYKVSPDENDVIIESPDEGAVIIQGLAAGKYYLKETKAPTGFNPLTAPQMIVIGPDDPENESDSNEITIDGVAYLANNTTVTVDNKQGVELPSTGGKGTMMLITFGTMIAIGFAVLMITQKKMALYND